MTKEENISTLNEHLDHWKRLLSEKICDQDEGEKTIDALQNAIKALEQDPCGDAISRQVVLDEMYKRQKDGDAITAGFIKKLQSVTPQPKKGHWIKCIDDNGSSYYLCNACRCGEDFKFDFCPNCGSKNSE